MATWKYAAGSWVVGPNRDRFVDYTGNRSLPEKVKLLSEIEGVTGIELLNPYDDIDVPELKKALNDYGMNVTSLLPGELNDTAFKFGALSNTDEKERKKAIDAVRQTADLAHEVGSEMVNVWAGQDGHDYLFQIDFEKRWELFSDSIATVAGEYPNMKFAIEYKTKEPRTHCMMRDASRTLLLCEDIGLDNIGLNIDFGHAIIAKENPTVAAELAHHYGRLFHVHVNDSYGEWDDDLAVGTVYLWHTLEFLNYLSTIDYNAWVSLDIAPFREDSYYATEMSFRTVRRLTKFAEKLDQERLRKNKEQADALPNFDYLLKEMFGDA